jgi:hypothetical protein
VRESNRSSLPSEAKQSSRDADAWFALSLTLLAVKKKGGRCGRPNPPD